jgi:hypothetical protein
MSYDITFSKFILYKLCRYLNSLYMISIIVHDAESGTSRQQQRNVIGMFK